MPDQLRLGPLGISANGHFLVEDDGSPFFWSAMPITTVWTRLNPFAARSAR